MMRNIKLDKKLKGVILIASIVLAFSSILCIWHNYEQFNDIHKQQIETTQGVVGALIKEYPEKEVEIIENILKNDENNIERGKAILDKYGYNIGLSMKDDPTFKSYRNDYFKNQTVFILSLLVVNLILIIITIKYVYKYY